MLCVCVNVRGESVASSYIHTHWCYAHAAQSVKPVFLFSQLLYEHRLWLNASWNTNLFLALYGVIFRGAFCWTKIVKMTVKCKRKFASRPPCWFLPKIQEHGLHLHGCTRPQKRDRPCRLSVTTPPQWPVHQASSAAKHCDLLRARTPSWDISHKRVQLCENVTGVPECPTQSNCSHCFQRKTDMMVYPCMRPTCKITSTFIECLEGMMVSTKAYCIQCT